MDKQKTKKPTVTVAISAYNEEKKYENINS